jgi:hypothetical protein
MIMKKYLFIISCLFSIASFAQVDTVVYNTMYPNGQFGKKRTDTIYVLPRTALQYFNGFGSFVSLPDTVKSILSGTGYSKWAGAVQSHLTPTQVTADLNLFTSTLQGLTPLSGGGTTNFLRADGTWAAPPGGGGGGGLADSAYFWSRTGNVATFGDFLGTKNDLDFPIRVKDTVRLKIDSLTGVMYASPRALNTVALVTPASAGAITITNANTGSTLIGNVAAFNATATNSLAIGNGSSVGTGAGNVAIGMSSVVSGNGLALGHGSGATSTGGLAIGSSSFSGSSGISIGGFADARTGHGVAVGNAATATGTASTSLGQSSQATGIQSVSVGSSARANTNYSTSIGWRATSTAANQFVGGGSQSGGLGSITDVYFGSGPSGTMVAGDTAAGVSYTIHGSGAGLGTTTSFNKNGGNLTLAGGKGTGSGTPGDLIFSTPTAAASSSTLQSLTQRWWVKASTGQLSNTASPNASLILNVEGTTGFFAPPRMTGAQASAVSSPADGSMVYITTVDATFTSVGFWGRINGVWTALHL